MTKPSTCIVRFREAALFRGAALVLCVLLAFGMLWSVPCSFAASETVLGDTAYSVEPVYENSPYPAESVELSDVSKTLIDDAANVLVEKPPTDPAAPNPADPPAVPSVPEYENAWPIGADEASAVVAELWADGTFVVNGAGAVRAFDDAEDVPWLAAGVADDIERVVFADKVEAESLAHWFEGCSNLSEFANVPATAKDLTRAFYDCPKLVELPDELEFAVDAILEECFGFAEPNEQSLATMYRGADKNVLAYAWEADGRVLVNPDAPQPPSVEQPEDPEDDPTGEPAGGSADEPTGGLADDPFGEPEGGWGDDAVDEPADDLASEPNEEPQNEEAEPDPAAPTERAVPERDPDPEPAASEEQAAQINITVPSSVSMKLGQDNPNSATIPVLASNRSERAVAITGARLKRADMDLSGGSWTLTDEDGATTFVQNARFTPLGLEVSFDRPVVLAAGDAGTQLVWHGSFTDYGMKKLLNAVLAAGDAGFTYGSMIWIVSAES